MKHTEGVFEGVGKINIYWQRWLPEQEPQAVLIIVHGIGEHSGRYRHVVNYLVPRKYAIYTYDLRGHGRSEGQRGHTNDWSEFRDDLKTFVALVRNKAPSLPLFILGHSMGGIVVFDYCLRFPEDINGVIGSAPAIGKVNVSPLLWFIARILDRVRPNFSLSPQTGTEWKISRDPQVLEANKHDPLTHRQGTPRLALQMRKTVERIHAHAAEWCLPLLIVHGTDDNIASPEGSRRFIHNTICPDVELREYEGGYHELYNDIIREEVLADTEQWLVRHLTLRSAGRR